MNFKPRIDTNNVSISNNPDNQGEIDQDHPPVGPLQGQDLLSGLAYGKPILTNRNNTITIASKAGFSLNLGPCKAPPPKSASKKIDKSNKGVKTQGKT